MNNIQRKINKETDRIWYKNFYEVESKFEGKTMVDYDRLPNNQPFLTEDCHRYMKEMSKIPSFYKIRKELRRKLKNGQLFFK